MTAGQQSTQVGVRVIAGQQSTQVGVRMTAGTSWGQGDCRAAEYTSGGQGDCRRGGVKAILAAAEYTGRCEGGSLSCGAHARLTMLEARTCIS